MAMTAVLQVRKGKELVEVKQVILPDTKPSDAPHIIELPVDKDRHRTFVLLGSKGGKLIPCIG